MQPPVFIAAHDELAVARQVVLAGAEGRHAAAARRLRPGERVDLTDGAGLLAECVVVSAGSGTVTLDVLARHHVPRGVPRITVVQALPKGDRGELAVETMTEIGVDTVIPWAAARCVVRWDGVRGERSLARWRSAAREAAKQSRQAWIPQVTEVATTSAVAARVAASTTAVVLDPAADARLTELSVPAEGEVILVIGPEGGSTDEELTALRSAGAVTARLGKSVLRTSTAGAAAAVALIVKTGRWLPRKQAATR